LGTRSVSCLLPAFFIPLHHGLPLLVIKDYCLCLPKIKNHRKDYGG
jgi:hypothetical protein